MHSKNEVSPQADLSAASPNDFNLHEIRNELSAQNSAKNVYLGSDKASTELNSGISFLPTVLLENAELSNPGSSNPGFVNAELAGHTGAASDADLFSLDALRRAELDKAMERAEQESKQEQFMLALRDKLEKTKKITSRKSSDVKAGDAEADVIVKKDGSIVVNPDKLASSEGELVVQFEVDDSAQKIASNQKAVIRDMISFMKMQNPDAEIPSDWNSVLAEELPPPVMVSKVSGGSASRAGVASRAGAANPVPSGGGYRSMPSLRAFDGGGYAGSGGSRSSIIPSGIDRSGKAMDIHTDKSGKLVDNLRVNNFVDKVVAAVSGNEGNFTAINPNDAGYGISIGIRQWNQKAGELPHLFKAWHDHNPQQFKEIFANYSDKLLSESFVRSYNMAGDGSLMKCIQHALANKDLQKVQVELAREFVQDGIKLGMQYGLRSELGLALVCDIVNQKGRGGAEQVLKKAGLHAGTAHVANEGEITDRLSAVSNRPGAAQRYALLKNHFNGQSKADIELA